MNQAEFDKAVRESRVRDRQAYSKAAEDLLYDTLSLVGLIATHIPRQCRPGSRFARAGGSQWTNDDLMIVAKKIEVVTYRFDALQHALGLWEHDARFGHRPPGSTNPPEETPPAAKRPKAKAPSKPKSGGPKPPSQRPPKHGGGAGYNDNTHH